MELDHDHPSLLWYDTRFSGPDISTVMSIYILGDFPTICAFRKCRDWIVADDHIVKITNQLMLCVYWRLSLALLAIWRLIHV